MPSGRLAQTEFRPLAGERDHLPRSPAISAADCLCHVDSAVPGALFEPVRLLPPGLFGRIERILAGFLGVLDGLPGSELRETHRSART